MVVIAKEEMASKIFQTYWKSTAAFTTTSKKSGVKVQWDDGERSTSIAYKRLDFLPTDDEINAVRDGSVKLKTLIKRAVKALRKPSMDPLSEQLGIGMGLMTMILMSHRKAKAGPAVLVFILDDEDEARNKIVTKFLKALFAEFGIKPKTKWKEIKDVFTVSKKEVKKIVKKYNDGRKKKRRIKASQVTSEHTYKTIRDHVIDYVAKEKNKCLLSDDGRQLKDIICRYYGIEILNAYLFPPTRSSDEEKMTVPSFSRRESAVNYLTNAYTGDNLKGLSKKMAKRMAKKNKAAVAAYKSLVDIMQVIRSDAEFPKVKYGYTRYKKNKGSYRKGDPKDPKMNVKKFKKFMLKGANASFLKLLYAHTTLIFLGEEVGSAAYKKEMKITCANFKPEGFAKIFIQAATAYAKVVDEKSGS